MPPGRAGRARRRRRSSSSPTGSPIPATSAPSCARPRPPASTPSCSRRARSTRSTRRSCGPRRARCSTSPSSPADAGRRPARPGCACSARRRTAARRTPTPTGPAGWPSSLGSEAHGLPDDAPVDEWVRIAHAGRAESLNVAMAATVLCFEAAAARALTRHPSVEASECRGRRIRPSTLRWVSLTPCTSGASGDFGAPGEPGAGCHSLDAPLLPSPPGVDPVRLTP